MLDKKTKSKFKKKKKKRKNGAKKKLEMQGIDPRTSHMLSERSTI